MDAQTLQVSFNNPLFLIFTTIFISQSAETYTNLEIYYVWAMALLPF
jgi:hypothetical protein